jgi:fumarate reductase flavoprotein subunit
MARGPWHEETDLIIVGGSVGGLAAAVLVADRGGRAILVERTRELGGGAPSEPEAIPAAGSRFQRAAGVEDSPERFAEDLDAASGHRLEPELTRALVGQGAALVAWLADRCGSRVQFLPGRLPAGHSVPRLHVPGERGGVSLTADLTRAATRHSHVSVRVATVAERLVRDESGAVRGISVRAERRGAAQGLGGRVLLACGGFVADDPLVAEHCPTLAEFPHHGAARPMGDALRLGLEAGAGTSRLGTGAVTPFLAMPGALAVSAPLVELGGILVNQAGRRFVDETVASVPLARAVRAQPGHLAYLIFDERIAAAARAADPFFAHVILPRTGRRAASLVDLAKQFELDADGLAAAVEAFNEGSGAAGDRFGRAHVGRPFEPPFHAIRVTGARRHTLGGLAVDAAARVLEGPGRPISGLYAAGGAAAGLAAEGSDAMLAGVETLTALGLARLAALDVIAGTAEGSGEPA